MEQTKALVKTITEGIQEKKGTDIVVADLTKIEGTICKYFIICQGNSPTQVEAIAESIGDFARTTEGEAHTCRRTGKRPMGGHGLYRCPGPYLPARCQGVLRPRTFVGRCQTDPYSKPRLTDYHGQ